MRDRLDTCEGLKFNVAYLCLLFTPTNKTYIVVVVGLFKIALQKNTVFIYLLLDVIRKDSVCYLKAFQCLKFFLTKAINFNQ